MTPVRETARSASAGACRCRQITRKTDEGLPDISRTRVDVFILSGAEDLVPVLDTDGTVCATTPRLTTRTASAISPPDRGTLRPDRALDPDRATATPTGAPSPRTTSCPRTARTPGRASPTPPTPQHVFSWLICETRDDKGNAIVYAYKREDGAAVDLSRASEQNRGDPDDLRRTANRYLKRIHYGNREPLLDASGDRPRS